jgi:thioredoxin-like negative regulator of GroEL
MKPLAPALVPSLLAAVMLAVAPQRGGAAPVPGVAAQAVAAAVAWVQAGTDADVDAAFATARADNKPVLLYWGAKWCPPCNHLSSTLFNRQDFIERTRAFVPVYVDGDRPGAQKLGARFKARGYPTMVLFDPQGRELSRLPGEADAPQVLALMQIGLSRGRPIQAVLADARDPARAKTLAPDDWRLLAFHSWDTDEGQLVPEGERPALLAALAVACPDSEAATKSRLWLKALAASDDGKGVKPDAALRERVLALLADPAATRMQMDVIGNYGPDIARVLRADAPATARAGIVAAFDSALRRLQADTTLSRADRVTALGSRVELARLDAPKNSVAVKLPAPLLAEVRAQATRDDREIRDGYERQAVVTSAAYVYKRAGLLDESDALLKSNLARSHSAYYLMLGLAGNAKARGDKTGALNWYEQAFDKSEGPATRLQWGATYVNALVEMAPQDAARIERAARQVFSEAATQPDAFHERSGRSLQRIASRLVAWNQKGGHDAALQRLRAQLDPVCAKLPAGGERTTCDKLLKTAGASA